MPDGFRELRFACECVSAKGEGYSDPWAAIAQKKLLIDGTKEEIINLVAREPRTIAQLAKELNISKPSVHAHINEMVGSELLRESEEWEKRYPTERYYELNFPVIGRDERSEFQAICEEMAERVASLFERKRAQLERAFDRTDLAERGWEFADLSQYLYAIVQRRARSLLEEREVLAKRERHRNGAAWVFWAEEPEAAGKKKYKDSDK